MQAWMSPEQPSGRAVVGMVPPVVLCFAGGSAGATLAAVLRRRRPELRAVLSLAVSAGVWEFTEPSRSRLRRADLVGLLDYVLFWLFALGLRGVAIGRLLPPLAVAGSPAGRRLALQAVGIWLARRLARTKPRLAPYFPQHVLAFLWTTRLAAALDEVTDALQDEDDDADANADSSPADYAAADFAAALAPQAPEVPAAASSSNASASAAEAAVPAAVTKKAEPLGTPPSIPAMDKLAAKALKTLQEHVVASNFEPMKSDPEGHPVQLGQKPIKKTSMPVIRARWIIDTADLPGDPNDLWSHLVECTAALVSYDTMMMIDFEIEAQKTLVVTKSATVCWQAMRKNAVGIVHDYVLANTMEAAEDRISVAACSIPAELLGAMGESIKVPSGNGYTRNFKHVSGVDVRKIGNSKSGIQLQCTAVLHMDVEGLNFVVKNLAPATMGTAMKNMLVRHRQILGARLRPEDVTTTRAGVPETLFALPAVFGKSLRVPYHMYAALADRIPEHGAVAAPPLPVPQGPFLEGPVADEKVEGAARDAMAKAREFIGLTAGWERQKDLGPGTEDIAVDTRAVPNAKLPCFRCRLTAALPDRYGGDLRLAAFEAAAIWLNYSTFFLLDTIAEKNVALRWCPTATAVFTTPGRCSGRTMEVSMEKGGGATICMALGAVPSDYAKKTLIPKDAGLEITDRINVLAVQFRTFEEGGEKKIEVTTITSIFGDAVPRLIPTSLVKRAVMMLQPGKITRWQAFFASGLFSQVIDSVSSSPRIPSVEAVVGGTAWRIEAGLHACLKPLLDTIVKVEPDECSAPPSAPPAVALPAPPQALPSSPAGGPREEPDVKAEQPAAREQTGDAPLAVTEEDFKRATEDLKTLKGSKPVPSERKLILYGIFSQIKKGDNTTARPGGMMNLEGKAKWDAHEKCKGMSKEDCYKAYVEEFNRQKVEFA